MHALAACATRNGSTRVAVLSASGVTLTVLSDSGEATPMHRRSKHLDCMLHAQCARRTSLWQTVLSLVRDRLSSGDSLDSQTTTLELGATPVAVAWNGDGSALAVGTADGRLHCVTPAGTVLMQEQILDPHRAGGRSAPLFSGLGFLSAAAASYTEESSSAQHRGRVSALCGCDTLLVSASYGIAMLVAGFDAAALLRAARSSDSLGDAAALDVARDTMRPTRIDAIPLFPAELSSARLLFGDGPAFNVVLVGSGGAVAVAVYDVTELGGTAAPVSDPRHSVAMRPAARQTTAPTTSIPVLIATLSVADVVAVLHTDGGERPQPGRNAHATPSSLAIAAWGATMTRLGSLALVVATRAEHAAVTLWELPRSTTPRGRRSWLCRGAWPDVLVPADFIDEPEALAVPASAEVAAAAERGESVSLTVTSLVLTSTATSAKGGETSLTLVALATAASADGIDAMPDIVATTFALVYAPSMPSSPGDAEVPPPPINDADLQLACALVVAHDDGAVVDGRALQHGARQQSQPPVLTAVCGSDADHSLFALLVRRATASAAAQSAPVLDDDECEMLAVCYARPAARAAAVPAVAATAIPDAPLRGLCAHAAVIVQRLVSRAHDSRGGGDEVADVRELCALLDRGAMSGDEQFDDVDEDDFGVGVAAAAVLSLTAYTRTAAHTATIIQAAHAATLRSLATVRGTSGDDDDDDDDDETDSAPADAGQWWHDAASAADGTSATRGITLPAYARSASKSRRWAAIARRGGESRGPAAAAALLAVRRSASTVADAVVRWGTFCVLGDFNVNGEAPSPTFSCEAWSAFLRADLGACTAGYLAAGRVSAARIVWARHGCASMAASLIECIAGSVDRRLEPPLSVPPSEYTGWLGHDVIPALDLLAARTASSVHRRRCRSMIASWAAERARAIEAAAWTAVKSQEGDFRPDASIDGAAAVASILVPSATPSPLSLSVRGDAVDERLATPSDGSQDADDAAEASLCTLLSTLTEQRFLRDAFGLCISIDELEGDAAADTAMRLLDREPRIDALPTAAAAMRSYCVRRGVPPDDLLTTHVAELVEAALRGGVSVQGDAEAMAQPAPVRDAVTSTATKASPRQAAGPKGSDDDGSTPAPVATLLDRATALVLCIDDASMRVDAALLVLQAAPPPHGPMLCALRASMLEWSAVGCASVRMTEARQLARLSTLHSILAAYGVPRANLLESATACLFAQFVAAQVHVVDADPILRRFGAHRALLDSLAVIAAYGGGIGVSPRTIHVTHLAHIARADYGVPGTDRATQVLAPAEDASLVSSTDIVTDSGPIASAMSESEGNDLSIRVVDDTMAEFRHGLSHDPSSPSLTSRLRARLCGLLSALMVPVDDALLSELAVGGNPSGLLLNSCWSPAAESHVLAVGTEFLVALNAELETTDAASAMRGGDPDASMTTASWTALVAAAALLAVAERLTVMPLVQRLLQDEAALDAPTRPSTFDGSSAGASAEQASRGAGESASVNLPHRFNLSALTPSAVAASRQSLALRVAFGWAVRPQLLRDDRRKAAFFAAAVAHPFVVGSSEWTAKRAFCAAQLLGISRSSARGAIALAAAQAGQVSTALRWSLDLVDRCGAGAERYVVVGALTAVTSALQSNVARVGTTSGATGNGPDAVSDPSRRTGAGAAVDRSGLVATPPVISRLLHIALTMQGSAATTPTSSTVAESLQRSSAAAVSLPRLLGAWRSGAMLEAILAASEAGTYGAWWEHQPQPQQQPQPKVAPQPAVPRASLGAAAAANPKAPRPPHSVASSSVSVALTAGVGPRRPSLSGNARRPAATVTGDAPASGAHDYGDASLAALGSALFGGIAASVGPYQQPHAAASAAVAILPQPAHGYSDWCSEGSGVVLRASRALPLAARFAVAEGDRSARSDAGMFDLAESLAAGSPSYSSSASTPDQAGDSETGASTASIDAAVTAVALVDHLTDHRAHATALSVLLPFIAALSSSSASTGEGRSSSSSSSSDGGAGGMDRLYGAVRTAATSLIAACFRSSGTSGGKGSVGVATPDARLALAYALALPTDSAIRAALSISVGGAADIDHRKAFAGSCIAVDIAVSRGGTHAAIQAARSAVQSYWRVCLLDAPFNFPSAALPPSPSAVDVGASRIRRLIPHVLARSNFNLPLAQGLARSYGVPAEAVLLPFIQLLVLTAGRSASMDGAEGTASTRSPISAVGAPGGDISTASYEVRVTEAAIALNDDDVVAAALVACVP